MITEIQKRYEQESAGSCNLGCGSNLEFLDIQPGEVVLDLGCGRGKDTIAAAEICGSTGKAIGLDITDAMLETARKQAESAGFSNTEFIHGNIEQLPFEAESFNAVMSNCVINHARDKKRVYEEINRVLKSGGRFVVSDAVTRMPLPAEIKNDAEAWAQCFGGAVTEQEYFESILSAGFDNVSILNRREYLKNGYDFISLTIKAEKTPERR